MSELDLFLWLTVKCYSEVSTNRYWKFFLKMSDKRKYKKDSFTGEKGNHGTRKQTQIPITLTEGLAATDKG